MINLAKQSKHHARKHTAILQLTTTSKSYISSAYPKVAQHYTDLFEYISTYTFLECTTEQSASSRSCRQKVEITFGQFPSKYQKWRK